MIKKYQGFTLLELIFVIVIIGIISIVAIPRKESLGLSLEFQTKRLLNDLRYTQAMSMATGQRYYWQKNSNIGYQVADESGQLVIMPEGATVVTLLNQVRMTALVNLPNNIVAFDSLGSPYIGSGLAGTPLSNTAEIILSDGIRSNVIKIYPETGFMETL